MSQEIYDELIEAGAPKLPEGYFYRIRVSSHKTDPEASWVVVEVHKRERRGSTRKSEYAHVIRDRTFIGHVCQEAYKLVWPPVPPHSSLIGDHP